MPQAKPGPQFAGRVRLVVTETDARADDAAEQETVAEIVEIASDDRPEHVAVEIVRAPQFRCPAEGVGDEDSPENGDVVSLRFLSRLEERIFSDEPECRRRVVLCRGW